MLLAISCSRQDEGAAIAPVEIVCMINGGSIKASIDIKQFINDVFSKT
jgi:hypothetical protein